MCRKVRYIADLIYLHGNIRPGNITTLYVTLFRCFKIVFDFFVFLVKISRLYSFK